MGTYYIQTLRSAPLAIPLLGDVTFVPSADYATVTSVTARVYAQGTTTPIVATQGLGKPPALGGTCTANMFATLSALAPGNYDVTIVETNASGSTESGVSNAFTVPLS